KTVILTRNNNRTIHKIKSGTVGLVINILLLKQTEDIMYNLLQHLVNNNEFHAKWLNTLSFMENAGARKISLCEHPTNVDIIQLKHAAEEHRHAFYLKKQIDKINSHSCLTYNNNELLAANATRYYLHALDIQTR